MAWTAPKTWVSGTALTAADLNTFVRDNLNETAPAKATTTLSYFVGNGPNSIAERIPKWDTVTTSATTASTSFTPTLSGGSVGPTVTVVTGTTAKVTVTARMQNASASFACMMSYAVSGASTIASQEASGVRSETSGTSEFNRSSVVHIETGLTPGSNTFTAEYMVAGGTGAFANREILVEPL